MLVAVDVLLPSIRGPAAQEAAIASARRAAPDLDLRFHVAEDPDRRGPAWARNDAARRGSAPLIALLDDDDRWLPGRLTAAPTLLERSDVALVCGDAVLSPGGLFLSATRGGRRRAAPPGDRDHAALVSDCFVCASTVTLRRADWEEAGGMPEDLRNAEDRRRNLEARRSRFAAEAAARHEQRASIVLAATRSSVV